MKTIAMITARMGSERFPGKVMAELYGKPMIQWIYETMNTISGIGSIVLATGDTPENEPLLDHAAELGYVDVVVGPNDDLLTRHRKVIEFYTPDWVVELSGDSPIYTKTVIERFIEAEIRAKDAHTIGAKLPYNSSYGNPVGVLHARSWFQHYFDLQDAGKIVYPEQYWIETPDPEGETVTVDCTDILPPRKTPVKISVDYPLELAVLDVICRVLGHFPRSLEEVYTAYKNISSISAE